jgi:hypothetical protein
MGNEMINIGRFDHRARVDLGGRRIIKKQRLRND